MRSLEGKVAVVTGGSRGIGKAIAERLGHAGAHVAVNYLDDRPEALAVVEAIKATGSDAMAVAADVARKSMVDDLFARVLQRWERVDVLVNNAGVCTFLDFFDIDEHEWDRHHSVNLKGTFLCSQVAARIMVDAGVAGRIIAIASQSARVGALRLAHYAPTKAGQISLMQSMAVALGAHGITCNTVSPGSIRTALNAHLLDDPAVLKADQQRIPLGRVGDPTDVAGAVAFLASDDASYISGADILIDGGSFARSG